MGKRKLGALEKVEFDLANLQYKVRSDPASYKDEFVKQYAVYEASRDLFLDPVGVAAVAEGPGGRTDLFRDRIEFIAHVADKYYPELTGDFANDLIAILSARHEQLDPELREKIVGSLVLLRKKGLIDSSRLLSTLFPILTKTPSKSLRALLFRKVVSDLRASNSKTTNQKLNRTIQTVLFNLLAADPSSVKGVWAVKLTRELWKRRIWTDARAVEIMHDASLSDNEKVIIGGVRFFLGGDKDREDKEADDSSEEEEERDVGALRHQIGVNKKTRKNQRLVEKTKSDLKKRERKKGQPQLLNFSALHLLHDPQRFAEQLFAKHLQNTKSKLNLEQKLLVLQLVSRLVGLHKLTILNLYSYFLKYLTPRQPSVTSFLASLAQSTHNLVPPDMLEPLLQKIANEFVSEAAASQVASTGLNAIREICVRQPLAMNETLLQDLVMYRKSKDKGVMMGARGLLSLYREVGAEMLRKRDRGKKATMEIIHDGETKTRKVPRYGEEAPGQIEGLELLEAELGDAAGDEADWAAWNVQEESDSDDSGGWIEVSSEGELDISDSDEEKENKEKKKEDGIQNGEKKESQNEGLKADSKLSLAATRILTPADLQMLQRLRSGAAEPGAAARPQRTQRARPSVQNTNAKLAADAHETAFTAADLDTSSSIFKDADKKAEMEKEKEKHLGPQARRAQRKREQGKSSTNREKEKRKNMLMSMHRGKSAKGGLRAKSNALKAGASKGKGKQFRGRMGGKR